MFHVSPCFLHALLSQNSQAFLLLLTKDFSCVGYFQHFLGSQLSFLQVTVVGLECMSRHLDLGVKLLKSRCDSEEQDFLLRCWSQLPMHLLNHCGQSLAVSVFQSPSTHHRHLTVQIGPPLTDFSWRLPRATEDQVPLLPSQLFLCCGLIPLATKYHVAAHSLPASQWLGRKIRKR